MNKKPSKRQSAIQLVSSRADIKWMLNTIDDIFDRMDYGNVSLYGTDKDKKIVDKAKKLRSKYGC